MTKRSPLQQKGFSLLELSVVLVIMSIVISGALTLGTAKTQQNQLENSYEEMQEIQTALKVYLNEYGKLPCPASITLTSGNALYGREATDCSDASPPAGLTRVEYPASSGKYVRIGGVPFYSLGLPERYLGDSYNNRYVYAVMESAIPAFTSSSVGNIQILDTAGTAITAEAVAAIISHGPSHKGAYSSRAGSLFSACATTNKDGENCDADGVFTDAVYNDGATAASFYDDIILWNTRMTMFEAVATGGSTSTSTSSSSSTSSSGGPPARVFSMEYKGLTGSHARNLGLSFYDTRCNTLYPGSWVLRSSNLENIEVLPQISSAINAALDIDLCGIVQVGSVRYCQFEPTIEHSAQITSISAYYLNCNNWSSTSSLDTIATFCKNSPSSQTLRSTYLRVHMVSGDCDGSGSVLMNSSCNVSGPFICVGYKAGYP